MAFELYPYQCEGASWLSKRQVALLADEMGLGKTVQSIVAADLAEADKVCVLCPAIARINWAREFETFSVRERKFDVLLSGAESRKQSSVICSYELAMQLGDSWTDQFDLLILDEAHYLKSVDAKRSHKVLGKNGLVRKAKRVWALTGTPAPNHAGELWPMLRVFGATPLTYPEFIKRYCKGFMTAYGFRVTGTNEAMVPELKTLLSKIMLRRLKVDVLKNLPEITFGDFFVEPGQVDLEIDTSFIKWVWPSDRRAELKAKLVHEETLLTHAMEATGFGGPGAKMLEAMADSVSTLRRYIGLQKVQPAAELVTQELEAGAYEKIVIFAIHQGVIEGLRNQLKSLGVVTLYGGTPQNKRQKHVDAFQNETKPRIFIANIQAAGTAITLTAASQILFVEQDWVPGNNAQAAMRCHRIGQKRPVNVRCMAVADSIDEKVTRLLKQKTRELSAIFNGVPLQNAQHVGSSEFTNAEKSQCVGTSTNESSLASVPYSLPPELW